MKQIYLLLGLMIALSAYAVQPQQNHLPQTKKFGTKIIKQWKLERFPLHFSVIPAKTNFWRNRYTGRLERYEEFNKYGQRDGLLLDMQSDGIHPESASYTYKGEIVYMIDFFPNSSTPKYIRSFTATGAKDGYVIDRTLLDTGGYTENIEKYNNGTLVEVNGVKQAKPDYSLELFTGEYLETGHLAVKAENGKIKSIYENYNGVMPQGAKLTFINDTTLQYVARYKYEDRYKDPETITFSKEVNLLLYKNHYTNKLELHYNAGPLCPNKNCMINITDTDEIKDVVEIFKGYY
ncbi:hypothetical protein [Paludibacter sp.]|uniref:hypothetical protein n=1 Tax=Paludibacter sp. TaxID=1898105 RepID=UPI001352B58D|nr:hypothetical protein [Paludibacter sp.]MTK53881.1 hypothetical protein [Paludibacter sp.]